jgi:hypothetical protein
MRPPPSDQSQRADRARPIGRLIPLVQLAIPILLCLLGLAVLTGWLLNISALKTVAPGLTSMKANTAVGFLAAGGGLLLMGLKARWGRRAALVLGALVAMIGLVTLTEYLFGLKLGIDELLFVDPATTSRPFSGRMSPATAIGFTAAGASLMLLAMARSGRAVATRRARSASWPYRATPMASSASTILVPTSRWRCTPP